MNIICREMLVSRVLACSTFCIGRGGARVVVLVVVAVVVVIVLAVTGRATTFTVTFTFTPLECGGSCCCCCCWAVAELTTNGLSSDHSPEEVAAADEDEG